MIEWRGPAPYLFVAMTPQDSEDLKVAARGLIHRGQVPVCVTIGDTGFTTALCPKDGRYMVPIKAAVQRAGAIGEGAIVEVVLRLTAAPGVTSGGNCGNLTTSASRPRWWSTETPRTTRGAHAEQVIGARLRRCEPAA